MNKNFPEYIMVTYRKLYIYIYVPYIYLATYTHILYDHSFKLATCVYTQL